MGKLMAVGSAALRKAAVHDEAKQYILGHEKLYRLFSKAASRYVAGETLPAAVARAAQYNQQGLATSIEFMGENVKDEHEAAAATAEFLAICDQIASKGLKSNVSLDLSHIGLALSADLCRQHLAQLCEKAGQVGIEVMISAEDTAKTDAVLDMYLGMAGRYEHLGITVQAYLHRTRDDFKQLIQRPNRIRLVKGAFDTPEGLSLPRGGELNQAYLAYLDQLLASHHTCSIATHDPLIQQEAVKLLSRHQMPQQAYEFESLLGIATDQLLDLMRAGHPAKMYIVYGQEWYLYLCNRIAENPMNLFLALEDIMQS
ncbi:proline dehydrogenase family protein [Fulvivirgaceae bacterium PWU37]|uniref:proline dehydrogenase n=1 Tax=Dawidia soli TaxID=2782352 RepID=A0AAP2GJA4_9BACT|nr:proline dehydrogenase family protein [Dawidia soli]